MDELYVHDRTAAIKPVPAALARCLGQCFGRDGTPTGDDQEGAGVFLNQLRDEGYWLACMCRGNEVNPPPLMSPRLRQGQIHIWRHGVTPHAENCRFWIAPVAPDQPGNEPAGTPPWDDGWLLLKPARPPATDQPPPPGHGATPPRPQPTVEPQIPPLGRLLNDTLLETGYTIIGPGDTITRRGQSATSRHHDAYAALASVQDRLVAPGLSWRDVGCTFLPALRRHMAGLGKLASRFPHGTRAQGVFLGIVSEVTLVSRFETQLLWRGKDDRTSVAWVKGPVRYAPTAKSCPGPYWVIAQLAQKEGSDRFVPVAAYAQPVLSKSVLLPIDNQVEREVAETLLAQINYWARADGHNVKVQLEKPLVDELAADGTPCRPDFILWLPDRRRILVEASKPLGPDHSPEKALTYANMRTLPGFVALLEYQPADDLFVFAKRLTAIVAKSIS